MNRFAAFSDELQKIAYRQETHAHLGGTTMKSLGAGRGMSRLGVQGATRADVGIRHPWLPTSTAVHSFGGSTKKQLGQNVLQQQNKAVGDLVSAARGGGRAASTRASRGALELGQMSHSLADISSHYEKPLAARKAGARVPGISRLADRARTLSQALGVGGLTGTAIGGLEHLEGSISGHDVDVFDPAKSRIDRLAESRAAGAGRATRRKALSQLVKQHGMTPAQAEEALSKVLGSQTSGASQLAARASRDVRYLRGQAYRPARAALRALRFLR